MLEHVSHSRGGGIIVDLAAADETWWMWTTLGCRSCSASIPWQKQHVMP